MKAIVAGSRSIADQSIVDYVLNGIVLDGGIGITEVVSGKAKGVDTLAENWANINGIPIKGFPAKWDDISSPDAKIKTNSYGKSYNSYAGFWRNEKMAQYADILIAIWDGSSKGTEHMIKMAHKYGLVVFVYNVHTQKLTCNYPTEKII